MLDAQRFTGLNRSLLSLLVLIGVLLIQVGCNTGNRFGVQFGEPPIINPPPPPPPPVCDQPLLNDVTPDQGGPGTVLTFSGVNFSDTGGNRVVMSSFSGQAEIDALILSVNVVPEDPTDPNACGAVSTLTAMVPGGARSGPVTLLVDGIVAGAGIFNAAPEIVGYAIGDNGNQLLANAAGQVLPDEVVIYGYNLNGVTGATVDDGTSTLTSPNVTAGLDPGANYDLPAEMEAVRVEIPAGIIPSGDTSALTFSLTAATAGLPLNSSNIDIPLVSAIAAGEFSDMPPYVTAGLMPGGVRTGVIPLRFVIGSFPSKGRYDFIPEFENPTNSGNWQPCTAYDDPDSDFRGLGFCPGSLLLTNQAAFGLNGGSEMVFNWDSNIDLPDTGGPLPIRIRMQASNPIPVTALSDDAGVWESGTMLVSNDSAVVPAGSVVEDFVTPANFDFSAGGTAIWGSGALGFNPSSNEFNFSGDVGQGTVDVILQADNVYELNQGNGSIFNVTDPANVFEVLPIGPVPGEFHARTMIIEQGAELSFPNPQPTPLIFRCSGTGNVDDLVFSLAADLDFSGEDGIQGDNANGGAGGAAGPGGGQGGTGGTITVDGASQTLDSITPATAGDFGGSQGGDVDVIIPAAIFVARPGSGGGGGGAAPGETAINENGFTVVNRGLNGVGGGPVADGLGFNLTGGGGGGGGGAGIRRQPTTAPPIINNGGGGGGGGGAIMVVADGAVRITGTINLDGGAGQTGVAGANSGAGGGGGGGSLVIRASGNLEVGSTAVISAVGGEGGNQTITGNLMQAGDGGDGLILFETNSSLVAPGSVDDISLNPTPAESAGSSYGISAGVIEVGNGSTDVTFTTVDSPYLIDTDAGTITTFGGVELPVIGVDGVFEFGNLEVLDGAVVEATGSQSLYMRATGFVNIAGTIDVSGQSGGIPDILTDPANPVAGAGGVPGPGGGAGGVGGSAVDGATLTNGEDGGIPAGVPASLVFTGVPPGGDPGGSVPPDLIAAAGGADSVAGDPLAGCSAGGGGGGGFAEDGLNGTGAGDCNPVFPNAGSGGSDYGSSSFFVPDPDNPGSSIALEVGGLGGAGGGALFDSANTIALAATGGGGGGGYLEISAGGPLNVGDTAFINARGGDSFLSPEGCGAGGAGAGGVIRIRGKSRVVIDPGATLNVSGGNANGLPPAPGLPYPGTGSTSGGNGSPGWIRIETPLGFAEGINVAPAPVEGPFFSFGKEFSSAYSVPYSLVNDQGTVSGLSEVSNAIVVQQAGDGGNFGNHRVLYEGFGSSGESAGLTGDSLGLVSDPALFDDSIESLRFVILLYSNFVQGDVAPVIDLVEVPFTTPVPTPVP
ncbi:MAG: hypothetical protein CBC13_08600 [Planctomycetia bacterium TMED53]|nr:MAG: hypothetical protein CBC13_08600 [Planctomycetia bacterium TMED53]